MRLAALCSIALSLAITGVVASAPAQAQHNPSVDEMIKSLSPTPGGAPTRGIRIGQPPANPGTPMSAPPATSAPAPAVSLNVLFATGSADLTPEAIQTLDDLGRALTNPALTAYRFRVEGHTDTVGGRDYNKALSDRRAVAVADYLAGRFHVDHARLQPIGMGQEGLMVPTPDHTPEARNRRVLVVNIGS
ncbi:MAG TPA: OmpA family protein [Acetobacteraceae bacterium]|jgi:outer membrane protein OmpA-like peptidoglycan-associated protein